MSELKCNTDTIRDQVAPTLEACCSDLADASSTVSGLPSLEGCEEIGSIAGEIDAIKSMISEAKASILEAASYAEQKEKENLGIIDWIGSLFNKWFKKTNEEDNSSSNEEVSNVTNKKFGTLFDMLPSENNELRNTMMTNNLIEALAKKYGVETTTTTTIMNEKISEIPLYNQLDYGMTPYGYDGSSTIKSSGCGIASLAMVLSYLKDTTILPSDLVVSSDEVDEYHKNYNKYRVTGGSSHSLFTDTADEWGVTVENYYWGEAWGEGKLMEALANGQPVIFNAHDDSVFTGGGHFIVLTGLTEDGKIMVNDPNGANYMSGNQILKDGFENGFDPEYFKGLSGNYFVYSAKDTSEFGTTTETTTARPTSVILKEIKESAAGTADANLVDSLVESLSSNVKTITQSIYNRLNQQQITFQKYSEIPLYNQLDYADIAYFYGNVADSGCGITSYAMVLTYLLDKEITPDILAEMYGGTYGGSWGTSPDLFRETPEKDWGVTLVDECTWTGWRDGTIEEALKNGQPIIAYVSDQSIFTSGGHYVVITGITEDGKLLVNDPNGANYNKGGVLAEGFENGFTLDAFTNDLRSNYWIFEAKDTSKYINSNTNPNTQLEESPVVNDEKEKIGVLNYNGEILIASTGKVEYDTVDGKHVKETWCPYNSYNGNTQLDGIIANLKKYEGGKIVGGEAIEDLEYWVRDDGVQMLGDYVMVAADVKSRVNPWTGELYYEGGTCEYGDIVETTLGTGIIVDYCGDAVDCREKYGEDYIRYDIYAAWWEEPFRSMVYDDNYVPTNYSSFTVGSSVETTQLEKTVNTQNNNTPTNTQVEVNSNTTSTSNNTTSNNSTNNSATNNSTTNNGSTSGSPLGNSNSLTDMIMDKHVVEILANKYDVDTAGKTAVAVLDEIAIKYPELAEDLNDIKGMINSSIRFEGEINTSTNASTNTQVEVNNNSGVIEGLGTEDAREEHINIKQENSNTNTNNTTNSTKPSENKPSSGTTVGSNNSQTTVTPSNPGKVEISIEKCTPEAILEAAKDVEETTSHSEYISNILHNAGYLTEEEMNLYKDYSIEEICERFEEFGWEKITDTNKLEVGDIIIINNEKESIQIYAGDNKWYTIDENEPQQMGEDWTENTTWYAYRPSK